MSDGQPADRTEDHLLMVSGAGELVLLLHAALEACVQQRKTEMSTNRLL